MINKYEGRSFSTKTSGDLIIVKYLKAKDVKVKFLNTGYETSTTMDNILNGRVKDYLLPSVFGVGVLGGANYSQEYCCVMWRKMLQRCYNIATHERQPTYVNCTISDNFKYYPYFKEWCEKQTGFGNEGWQLDKDVLLKGNKIYSEVTCVFVPKEINTLLIKCNSMRGDNPIGVSYNARDSVYNAYVNAGDKGRFLGCYKDTESAFQAYKQAKEAYIKEVANKWKDQIDPRVYKALLRYEVEITD